MFRFFVLALSLGAFSASFAQEASDDSSSDATTQSVAGAMADNSGDAAATDDSSDPANLLSEAELENLVAPVALYPDTLLIQILVAATQPLQVVKANRFLLDNTGKDPKDLESQINAMGWDPSVAVLATAFPEVISQMATHIDWTDSIGTAMLAQSDDVMNAVQVMRKQAINSGALVSGKEQKVETDEDDNVAIVPTDPQVVYVPQYDPQTVYTEPASSSSNVGNVIGATFLAFTTFALIDNIFDDDDDWHGYWGCRDCGGWGGGPIIRNPNIDINVDGNVIIGNDINRGDLGWKPKPQQRVQARQKIATHNGATNPAARMPVTQKSGRTDELRQKLSRQTGVQDISREAGKVDRDTIRQQATERPRQNSGNVQRSETHRSQQTRQPQVRQNQPSRETRQIRNSTPNIRARDAGNGQAMNRVTTGRNEQRASQRMHGVKENRRTLR